jgi:hypothetical protein
MTCEGSAAASRTAGRLEVFAAVSAEELSSGRGLATADAGVHHQASLSKPRWNAVIDIAATVLTARTADGGQPVHERGGDAEIWLEFSAWNEGCSCETSGRTMVAANWLSDTDEEVAGPLSIRFVLHSGTLDATKRIKGATTIRVKVATVAEIPAFAGAPRLKPKHLEAAATVAIDRITLS